MKLTTLAAILLAAFSAVPLARPAHAEDVGCVSTTFRLIGKNDQVCVTVFDDPKVPGVACHVSQARTGGIGGTIGWSEDPSRFSIACRQVGPITVDLATLPEKEQAFSQRTSILFKSTNVARLIDKKRKTLVYVAISDKLIDGSPQNAISTVPVMPWGKD